MKNWHDLIDAEKTFFKNNTFAQYVNSFSRTRHLVDDDGEGPLPQVLVGIAAEPSPVHPLPPDEDGHVGVSQDEQRPPLLHLAPPLVVGEGRELVPGGGVLGAGVEGGGAAHAQAEGDAAAAEGQVGHVEGLDQLD